jgi:hypothetical protein
MSVANILYPSNPRCLIGWDTLVPGLKYGAFASDWKAQYGELFRDLKLAPGEVRDLGDLKVVPPKR